LIHPGIEVAYSCAMHLRQPVWLRWQGSRLVQTPPILGHGGRIITDMNA
jgi:hypothetical protein